MDKLSYFDAFPKVNSKCLKQTSVGGVTTIIVYCLIFLLFFWEAFEYFHMKPTHSFVIDSSLNDDMKVSLDISIASNCEDLLIAVLDSNGEASILNGSLNAEPIVFAFPTKEKSAPTQGCRLSGSFPVHKISGKIHIIPLPSIQLRIVGLPFPILLKSLNFSHSINKLSFGTDYPNQLNPLEGAEEFTREQILGFNYFVSIVPTQYKNYFGKVIYSNQYAVHEYSGPPKDTMPGIFFSYNLEPVSVIINENGSFLHTFIVRLVGIVGGVYTMSSILFNIVYYFMNTKEPNYHALSSNSQIL